MGNPILSSNVQNDNARRRGVVQQQLLALMVCLLGFSLTAGGFVVVVCSRPQATPLVTIAAGYDYRWDLNVWMEEDVGRLTSLNQGAYHVSPTPDPTLLSGGLWDRTDEVLRDALKACPDDQMCLVYLNLHGAVRPTGEPCLVLPGASPADPQSWVPLQALLDHIASSQPEKPRQVMLLFETHKLQPWLAAGIVENDFTARSVETITAQNESLKGWSFAALFAAQSGQRGLAVGDQVGSIGNLFTRMLVEGLAGSADGYGNRGGADGWVQLEELTTYVTEKTSGEAWRYRHRLQFPAAVLPAGLREFRVGLATRNEIEIRQSTVSPATEHQIESVRDAYVKLSELGSMNPTGQLPSEWFDLRLQAGAFAMATHGGELPNRNLEARKQKIDAAAKVLQQQLQQLRAVQQQQLDRQLNQQALEVWTAITTSPDWNTATGLLRQASSANNEDPRLAGRKLAPAELLLLTESPNLPIWHDPQRLRKWAQAEVAWYQVLCAAPDVSHSAIDREFAHLGHARRHLVDCLLCQDDQGAEPLGKYVAAPTRMIDQALNRFESQVQISTTHIQAFSEALAALDQGAALLPALCEWSDAVSALPTSGERFQASRSLVTNAVVLAERANSKMEEVTRQLLIVNEEHAAIGEDQYTRLVDAAEQLKGELKLYLDCYQQSLQFASDILHDHPAIAATFGEAALEVELKQPLSGKLNFVVHLLRDADQLISKTGASAVSDEADKSLNQAARPRDLLSRYFRGNLDALAAKTLSNQPQIQNLNSIVGDLQANSGQDHPVRSLRIRSILAPCQQLPSQLVTQSDLLVQLRQRMLATYIDNVLSGAYGFKTDDGTPYFESLSTELLRRGDQTSRSNNLWWTARRRQLQQRLTELRDSLNSGLDWSMAQSLPFAERVHLQLAKSEGDCFPLVVGDGIGYIEQQSPASDGALLNQRTTVVRHVLGRLSNSEFRGQNLQLALPVTSEQLASARIDYVFRGNRFPVTRRSGISPAYLRAPATIERTPTLAIHSGREETSAVMFILDCSASMAREVAVDEPQSGVPRSQSEMLATENRLTLSKRTLLEVLRRSTANERQVGVMLYGHRVANDPKGIKVLFQDSYYKAFPFPADLRPYSDIEMVLPVGRFSPLERSLLEARLDPVAPWGETPLYLAIKQAIESMESLPKDTRRDIVVISDGRNYQFNPDQSARVALPELITLAKNMGVRINVVAFEVEESQRTLAEEEFRLLASSTAGLCATNVDSAVELLGHLENVTTNSKKIQITDGHSTQQGSLPGKFELAGVTIRNTYCDLQHGKLLESIPVSPGMDLELLVDAVSGAIRSVPYRKHLVDTQPMLLANGMPSVARVGLHCPLPQVSADGASSRSRQPLQLSFSRSDEFPTDRPAHVWVEVELAAANRNTANPTEIPVICSCSSGNVGWLAGVGSPVAQLSLHDIPQQASLLRCSVWCLPHEVSAAATVAIGKAVTGTEQFTFGDDQVDVEWQATDRYVDIDVRIKQVQVTNTERRFALSTNGFSSEVDSWYAADGLSSRHRVVLADGHGADEGFEISLVPVAAIKSQGAKTASPLQYQIDANDAEMTIAVGTNDEQTVRRR